MILAEQVAADLVTESANSEGSNVGEKHMRRIGDGARQTYKLRNENRTPAFVHRTLCNRRW